MQTIEHSYLLHPPAPLAPPTSNSLSSIYGYYGTSNVDSPTRKSPVDAHFHKNGNSFPSSHQQQQQQQQQQTPLQPPNAKFTNDDLAASDSGDERYYTPDSTVVDGGLSQTRSDSSVLPALPAAPSRPFLQALDSLNNHSKYTSHFADSPTIPECCDHWDCATGKTGRCRHSAKQAAPPRASAPAAAILPRDSSLRQQESPSNKFAQLARTTSRFPAAPVTPPSPPPVVPTKDRDLRSDEESNPLAFAMSETELLTVIGCVNAICSAYHEAIDLLNQIKGRRSDKRTVQLGPFPDDAMQELEQSLYSGQHIIFSQYERDYRRFGEAFADGDQSARDALKDIYVHVQQQINANLRLHVVQDTFVDFTAIQDVADSSQDRCVLLLMQLQQRLVASGPLDSISSPPIAVVGQYSQRDQSSVAESQDLRPQPLSNIAHERAQNGGLGLEMSGQPGNELLTPPRSPDPYRRLQQPSVSEISSAESKFTGHKPHPNAYMSILGNPFESRSALGSPNLKQASGFNSEAGRSPYLAQQRNQLLKQAATPLSPHLHSPPPPTPPAKETPDIRRIPHRPSFQSSVSDLSDTRDSSRSGSSQSQHAPYKTPATEKVGFFGIMKNKMDKSPKSPSPSRKLSRAPTSSHGVSQGGAGRISPPFNATSSTGYASAGGPQALVSPTSTNTSWESEGAAGAGANGYPRPITSRNKSSFESANSQGSTGASAASSGHAHAIPHLSRAPTSHTMFSTSPQAYSYYAQQAQPLHLSSSSSNNNNNISRSQTTTNGYEISAPIRAGAKELLPHEGNKFVGFCKGAWRQQIGDRKKAMEERVRPGAGLHNSAKYWQCKTCRFEGNLVPISKKQNGFDMRVYTVVEGVAFRWEFLFKSHMPLRGKDAATAAAAAAKASGPPAPGAGANAAAMMMGAAGGSGKIMAAPPVAASVDLARHAIYGCLFCVAEGQGNTITTGVQEFMQHIAAEHRERLPAGEVLYRTNCIVGRQASPEEDFDVNIIGKEGVAF